MALTHSVTNHGNVPLSDVTVSDSTCTTIVGPIGDANTNNRLDLSEVWTYVCDVSLTRTTTNTAEVQGTWRETSVSGRDRTLLIVGEPLGSTPHVGLESVISPRTLPVGGGDLTVRYLVHNKGDAPLSTVAVGDGLCVIPRYLSGDLDQNSILDLSKTWVFGCVATIGETTTSVANATAQFAEREVSATDAITIAVAPPAATETPTSPPGSAAPTPSGSQSALASGAPSSSVPSEPAASAAPSPGIENSGVPVAFSQPPRGGWPSVFALLLIEILGIAAAGVIVLMSGRRERREP